MLIRPCLHFAHSSCSGIVSFIGIFIRKSSLLLHRSVFCKFSLLIVKFPKANDFKIVFGDFKFNDLCAWFIARLLNYHDKACNGNIQALNIFKFCGWRQLVVKLRPCACDSLSALHCSTERKLVFEVKSTIFQFCEVVAWIDTLSSGKSF